MKTQRIDGAVARKGNADLLGAPAGTRQNREKASRFAVLGMLALGKQASGYDLKKAIAASTANFWSESYGNIYPTLKRLLAEGAIQRERGAKPANNRSKQLYRITEKGRIALRDWLRQPPAIQTEDNELLLKLFFGTMMSSDQSRELVRCHRDHHKALLKNFKAIDKIISKGPAPENQKIYMRATLQYGQAVSRALMEWSDATEKALRDLKP